MQVLPAVSVKTKFYRKDQQIHYNGTNLWKEIVATEIQ